MEEFFFSDRSEQILYDLLTNYIGKQSGHNITKYPQVRSILKNSIRNVYSIKNTYPEMRNANLTEKISRKQKNNNNLYLVPAFTGLGAPHWKPDARGTLVGITRDTERDHVIRATLESIAYQSSDLLNAMQKDGVKYEQWKPQHLKRFKKIWEDIAEEEAEKDSLFAEVYKSHKDFRKKYSIWGDRAYMK